MSSVTSYIARRYIFSKDAHGFLWFISILTILGVAIGSAAMIVVLSIINGFEDQLRARFLAANAHIIMFRFPNSLKAYTQKEHEVKAILAEDIQGIAPFIHMETMAIHGERFVNVLIRGIDAVKREAVQPLKDFIYPKNAYYALDDQASQHTTSGSSPPVIIGSGLARILTLKVGDIISLVSPYENSILGQYHDHRVIGIYDSGLSHYDDKLIITSLQTAQTLFHMEDAVTGLEIGLHDPWQSLSLKQLLSQKFRSFQITHWQEYNKSFFEAIKYERTMIGLLVALVALVGGFNILTTLFVSIFQKERDISLLRSIGCTRQDIVYIFIQQGFLIGTIGCILGVILALIICASLEKYQFITLPDVYELASIPIEYNPMVYGITCVCAIIIATTASIIPARNASTNDLSTSLKCRN